MNRFAAHLIMVVKLKKQVQKRFSVWENIVLIKADTEDQAFVRAEQRGREEEGDEGGSFRWEGHPATWVFAGVRKLTVCDDAEKRPGDGTEVTFIEMEVNSEEAVQQLVEGEPVSVRFKERFQSASEA